MKLLHAWLILIVLVTPAMADGQPPSEDEAIRKTALDYIEGWYIGDAERMARALHPDLAKRIVGLEGENVLHHMTAAQLIEGTEKAGGSRTPVERRRSDVRILDVYEGNASVRVDAADFVDYLHLARIDGRWLIINVLWALRPE
jgi:hypothetical protein